MKELKDLADKVADLKRKYEEALAHKEVKVYLNFDEVQAKIAVFVEKADLLNEEGARRVGEIVDAVKNSKLAEIGEVMQGALATLKEIEKKEVVIPPFPKIPEVKIPPFPEKVKVGEMDKPKWYEAFSDTEVRAAIKSVATEIVKQLKAQEMQMPVHEDKKRALAVRVVSPDGKQYVWPGGASSGGSGIGSLSTGKTVVRVPISISASGDNTVVSASASKKIKIRSLVLVANAAVNLTFKSGVGTSISGAIPLDAQGAGFVLPAPMNTDEHWMETAAGELLNFNLSGAVQVSGFLTYIVE